MCSMEREYEDICAAIEAVGSSPHLIGHSFGALGSLGAALRAEVSRLVLYEPPVAVDRPVVSRDFLKMSAGITTYNALRNSGMRHDIDRQAQKPAAELVKVGRAKVVLATVTNGKARSAVVGGLGVDGKLIILGAAGEPLTCTPGNNFGPHDGRMVVRTSQTIAQKEASCRRRST